MFDGKNAKFTVLNSGQISATVPSGIKIPPGLAAEVLITVTNPAGMATSAGAFTVTK
jgi:hypothetical protein